MNSGTTQSELVARWLRDEMINRRRMVPLPDHLALNGILEAYAAQDALIDAMGGEVAGWKVAWTTPVMQQFVGVDHPCCGAMFRGDIHPSPAEFAADTFMHLAVEPEVAVRIGEDLGPTDLPYERDTVADAIECVMPAIETLEDRHLDMNQSTPELMIAANALAAGCVLGPAIRNWRTLDIADLNGHMRIDGAIVGEGNTSAVLGDPLNAVTWLANHLPERNRMLQAGDVVLTGSIVKPHWVGPGESAEMEIEQLGAAGLRVLDRP